ncbi:MAG: D-sedoheptulose 7-phosphate isomerase [Rikenellaceae bacterium]
MQEYIKESLLSGLELRSKIASSCEMTSLIESVGRLMAQRLKSGSKILFCGNGGSAADAQHISSEFVGRFVAERRPLPAVALTTDTSLLTAVGNDYGFEYIFSRQVQGLAQEGDILVGFSTSGNSKNVIKALEMARDMGITTVGFLGGSGGACKPLCDYDFTIDTNITARIQEMHITIGHILCGIVDKIILDDE